MLNRCLRCENISKFCLFFTFWYSVWIASSVVLLELNKAVLGRVFIVIFYVNSMILLGIGTIIWVCSLILFKISNAISWYYSKLTHDLIVNWDIIHDYLSKPRITFKHNAYIFLEIRLFIQFCHRLCAFLIVRLSRPIWLIHFTHLWFSEAVHKVFNVIVKLFSCASGASIFFSLLRSDNIATWSSYTIICNQN